MGYIDANCSMFISCNYWDEPTGAWSSKGLTTTIEPGVVVCGSTHLTTFGGILSLPSTVEELLAELAAAVKFNTFTVDEMFSLIANFGAAGSNRVILCSSPHVSHFHAHPLLHSTLIGPACLFAFSSGSCACCRSRPCHCPHSARRHPLAGALCLASLAWTSSPFSCWAGIEATALASVEGTSTTFHNHSAILVPNSPDAAVFIHRASLYPPL